MRNRLGIVVLAVVCLGLFIALVTIKRQATVEKTAALEQAQTQSNETWVAVNSKLDELKKVNSQFEKDLDIQKSNYDRSIADLTNKYSTVSESLVKTEAQLKTKEVEVAQRDARITDLEKENQALDRHALDLSTAITNLNVQIADTKQKLASSEGEKSSLELELKRLMGEKNELERQFSDLNVLRTQVAKLKQEMNMARRLEWMRTGVFASADQKGAQKLLQGVNAPQTATGKTSARPNYDLNVEVTSDGNVRLIPPATNSPAAK